MNSIICFIVGVICGGCVAAMAIKEYIGGLRKRAIKSEIGWKILTLSEVQKKRIHHKLSDMNITQIAIYGCGDSSILFSKLMEEMDIEVGYYIDKNAKLYPKEYNVHSLVETIERVDAIVVMPVWEYRGIEEELNKVTQSRIIAITEIL